MHKIYWHEFHDQHPLSPTDYTEPPFHPLDLAKRIPFWIGAHSNVTLILSYIHHWIVAWRSTLNGVRYGWFLSHTWSIHRPYCSTSLLKCCTGDLLIYISELFLELWILLQVLEMQQRKCSVIFDLSCNLARVLEFCTCEIPQAFLSGPGINLQRLTELIIFILNHVMMAGDSEFFDL